MAGIVLVAPNGATKVRARSPTSSPTTWITSSLQGGNNAGTRSSTGTHAQAASHPVRIMYPHITPVIATAS